MAITTSAKKAIRVSERRRVFNLRRKNNLIDITKRIKRLVVDKKIADAKALIPEAYKAIDKAAKSNFWHKNKAAHAKSQIASLVNKIDKK